MFISGNGTNKVYEYNLSTAYDTSTAVYSNNSVSLSGQDNSPLSLTFNNDGTKMFVLGTQNDSVYEYTLSVGFDLSSDVTYTNNSVSVSTQESTPIDVTFNNDGTKMFVTGWTNDTIFEYTVSTGFDLSDVSYSNNSYSISSQENYPTDIKFNNDGTKMFAIGIDGDDVNEYTLSSPFDLTSTITHLGSFDISSQETFPYGLEFNNDGTKMYVVGVDGDDVNEYTLTSPFSLINVTGEHSGDVIDTSSSSNSDSDADVGDTLTVTNISHSNTNTDTVESGSTYSDSGGEPGSIAGTYGTITIGADGSYQYVADLDATDALDAGDIVTDTFTYTVSDGAATDTADIVITVVGINDAPTAVADTDSVDAGSTVTDTTNSAGTLVSDDTDPDASSSLYITQVTPSGGSATSITYNSTKTSNAATITGSKGTLTIGSDGSYSYAANSNASSGNDVFTYTLTDGTSTTTSTLTISVTEINNAPTASNNTVTTNEDTDHTFAASEFGFTDVDGDSLDHVTIETLPSNGTLLLSGSAVSAGDQISAANITNLVFRPAANANGSGYGSFTFSVNDGTVDSSSTYTMTVDVTAVNDAPTVVNDTDSVTEGGTVIETTNSAGTVLSDDSDVDGDSLTVSGTVTQTSATANGGSSITISSPNSASVGSAVTGYYGQLTLDSDGTYSYTANQSTADALDDGESGTDVFTFTVSDGTTTTSSTITFTVNGANDAPTVVNDTDSVTEGGTVIETTNSAGTVLSDDSDVDGDSLTVSGTVTQTSATANGGSSITISSPNSASVGSAVTGYYGQLTLDSDGTYSYTANQSTADALDDGESGTDVFTFTVSDGTTTTSSTITFTVNGANDAPTASNNTVTTNEDTTYTFTADDFNFSDVDGDTLSSVTVSALSGSNGTFSLNGTAITGSTTVTKTQIDNGSLTFAPDSNENGSDYNTFTFTVK